MTTTNPYLEMTFAQLTGVHGRLMRAKVTEANRFSSMDLCDALLKWCDEYNLRGDYLMVESIRKWIGRLQARYQG